MHAWEFYDDADVARRRLRPGDRRRPCAISASPPTGSPSTGWARPGSWRSSAKGSRSSTRRRVTTVAREIKTPEEIALFAAQRRDRHGDARPTSSARSRPAIRERELLAILADTLLRRGGEHLATSTVCSGPNTNPWRAEATARVLEAGDLVYVDTDAVGVEGYFFCVSRTFLCGDGPPTPAQREVYRIARDWLRALREQIRPGLTCRELAAKAPRLPAKFMPQRYEVMIHSIGLEEESPSVAYPERSAAQRRPRHPGEHGPRRGALLRRGRRRDGVKLGDEVLVTSRGPRGPGAVPALRRPPGRRRGWVESA